MPIFTPNYNLGKPQGVELVDEAVYNANLDIIDTNLELHDNTLNNHEGRLDLIEADHAYIRKTADELVNNSVAMQNDDHFSFPVEANSFYAVEVTAIWAPAGGASTAMDCKVGWNLPAGAVYSGGVNAPDVAMAGGVSVSSTEFKAQILTGVLAVAHGLSTNTDLVVRYYYTLVIGANAGNAIFQWAQNTAVAFNLTLKANSLLRWEKIS